VLLIKWSGDNAAVAAITYIDDVVVAAGGPREEQHLQLSAQYLDRTMQGAYHYLERDTIGDRTECLGMRPTRFDPNGGRGCYPRTVFEIIDECHQPLEKASPISIEWHALYASVGDCFCLLTRSVHSVGHIFGRTRGEGVNPKRLK
jgi:hypothetical protein